MSESTVTGITILAVSPGGFIRVTITNPAPGGGEAATASNDVYRRNLGDTDWTRIATGVAPNGTYDDYGVASSQMYEYKVRAIGDTGGTTDSAVAALSLTLTGIWLHDPASAGATVRRYEQRTLDRSSMSSYETGLHEFAGRALPVVEFGDGEDEDVDAAMLLLNGSGDLAALRTLVERRAVVCYRDSAGRKVFGVIDELPVTDERLGARVRVGVTAVDFSEAV